MKSPKGRPPKLEYIDALDKAVSWDRVPISKIYGKNPLPVEPPDVDLYKAVDQLLATLTPREEDILRFRFGIHGPNGAETITLREIGERFGGVTANRIRQIEAKALRKLRHPQRSKKQKPYLCEKLNLLITGGPRIGHGGKIPRFLANKWLEESEAYKKKKQQEREIKRQEAEKKARERESKRLKWEHEQRQKRKVFEDAVIKHNQLVFEESKKRLEEIIRKKAEERAIKESLTIGQLQDIGIASRLDLYVTNFGVLSKASPYLLLKVIDRQPGSPTIEGFVLVYPAVAVALMRLKRKIYVTSGSSLDPARDGKLVDLKYLEKHEDIGMHTFWLHQEENEYPLKEWLERCRLYY